MAWRDKDPLLRKIERFELYQAMLQKMGQIFKIYRFAFLKKLKFAKGKKFKSFNSCWFVDSLFWGFI